MTHQRVAGHVGDVAPLRSPDFAIGLAETREEFADSKIVVLLQ
jgi:hypothetical protein